MPMVFYKIFLWPKGISCKKVIASQGRKALRPCRVVGKFNFGNGLSDRPFQ
jgi:hypothetical protein